MCIIYIIANINKAVPVQINTNVTIKGLHTYMLT